MIASMFSAICSAVHRLHADGGVERHPVFRADLDCLLQPGDHVGDVSRMAAAVSAFCRAGRVPGLVSYRWLGM